MAITSERAFELLASIVHTADDMPEIIDPAKLVEVARVLHGLVVALDEDLARACRARRRFGIE